MCYYMLLISLFNWSFPLHDDHCKLIYYINFILYLLLLIYMRQRIASDTLC